MNEEKEVKVVTQTLDAGVAAPIAVTSEQALNIARAQNANNPVADIPLQEKASMEEIQQQVNNQTAINNQTFNVNNVDLYNQQVNIEKLHEVNDIVKVEKVKKENPKVVLVLILVLALIIIGFFVFELPVLVDMLK